MLILTDIQKVTVAVQPKSAAGNIALVDGKPVWTVSDDTIITLEVSEDGFSVEAITTGKLGSAQIAINLDSDLGEGVKDLTGILDVTVIASDAVNVEINVGTPSDR